MNSYLQSALSGWCGVLLLGFGLALPYLLRGMRGGKRPYLQRMWPHYWVGYIAFLTSFTHAWLAMRSGSMSNIHMGGLWVATIAIALILWQIAVGLMLRDPAQASRRTLRRTHFWTMVIAAGLIVAHVAFNKP